MVHRLLLHLSLQEDHMTTNCFGSRLIKMVTSWFEREEKQSKCIECIVHCGKEQEEETDRIKRDGGATC